MKKIILLNLILSSIAFSNEYFLTREVEQERGVSGLEFKIAANKVETKNKSKNEYITEKYAMIKNINENLFERLDRDDFEKEKLITFLYDNYSYNDSKADNFALLMANKINDDYRVGAYLDYLTFNNDERNTDGEIYQANLFFRYYNDDEKSFNASLYAGRMNEEYKIEKDYKGKYYGFNGELKKKYYTYSEINYAPFFKFDMKRYEDKVTEKKRKNDSIETALGISFEKEIFYNSVGEADIKISPIFSKEFLEERKYKDREGEEFKESLGVKCELPVRIGIVDMIGTYEIKKSLNTSNYENRAGIMLQINI